MVDVLHEFVESALHVASDSGLQSYQLFDIFLSNSLGNAPLDFGRATVLFGMWVIALVVAAILLVAHR